MAIYRQIHTTVWKDDWVGELNANEKLLWMYLTTNDRTTQCGVYVFSWRYAPFETGLSNEEIRKIIFKFQNDGKIKFNESNNEIMIVNWLKYNSARSPKVAAVIDKELKGIKTPEFESEVIMRSKDFDYPIKTEYSNSDTVSIPYQYPIDTVSRKTDTILQPEPSSSPEPEPSSASEAESEGCTAAANPVKVYQECFGVINPLIVQDIEHWVKDLSDELVCEAMKRASFEQKGYRYAVGIMKNWATKNIKTMDQVDADDRGHENRSKKTASVPKKQATNYGQTLYMYYEQELRYSPNLTLEEYASKKRLNERDRQALEQYIHSMGGSV
ncbi:DnaD domain-containing protein [Enterococcus avium]|uniref:DnaD domain-containing protein n=1 Tax=Enterococcus avium TaxID=33945 RepID=UPI001F58AAED|nr:DnaD domain protein [Enterococcus avium]